MNNPTSFQLILASEGYENYSLFSLFNYSCSCSYYIPNIIIQVTYYNKQCGVKWSKSSQAFFNNNQDLDKKFTIILFLISLYLMTLKIFLRLKRYLFNVGTEDMEVARYRRKSHSRVRKTS